ncbi:unnamed protein product [Cunninghamella echinulata]
MTSTHRQDTGPDNSVSPHLRKLLSQDIKDEGVIPVQSMEDQSNMHYQVLTSSYPVSPPHSPTSLYKFVQIEPFTHAPVLNNDFTPFSSFATTTSTSTSAHNDICPIAQAFSNSYQYRQQQQQQQQQDGEEDKKKRK